MYCGLQLDVAFSNRFFDSKLLKSLFIIIILQIFFSISFSQTWTNNGPEGGNVTTIEAAAWDEDILFIGTEESGIWRFDPDIEEWESISEGLPIIYYSLTEYYPVRFIRTHPEAEGKLWAVTAGLDEVFWISEDEGESWNASEDIDFRFLDIFIKEDDPDFIYGWTHEFWYLYISEDGGNTWRIDPDLPGGPVTAIPGNPNHIFIGNTFSVNGGNTWEQIGDFPINENARLWQLAVDPSDTSRIWAIIYDLDGRFMDSNILILSEDQGSTWSFIKFVFPKSSARESLLCVGHNGSVLIRSLEYLGDIVLSEDNGDSWSVISINGDVREEGNASITIKDIFSTAQEGEYYFAGYYGVYHTDNSGESLTSFNSHFVASKLQSLVISSNDPNLLYAGGWTGLYISENGGISWERLSFLYSYYIAKPILHPDTLYFVGAGEDIMRTHNGGIDWERVFEEPYEWDWSVCRNIITNPFNQNFIMAVYYNDTIYRVIRSEDGGTTWEIIRERETVNDDLNKWWLLPDMIERDQYYLFCSDLLISSDAGDNWQTINIPDEIVRVRDIALHYGEEENLVLTSGREIFISYDSGDSWETYSEGLQLDSTTVLQLKSTGDNYDLLFLRLNNGRMYYRVYGDEGWTIFENFLYDDIVDISAGDVDKIAIATTRHGVVIGENFLNVGGGSRQRDVSMPSVSGYSYPNPFNSSVNIIVQLQQPTYLNLNIYNSIGQLVHPVVSGIYPAGDNQILWTPENMSSGLYVIYIETPKEIKTVNSYFVK